MSIIHDLKDYVLIAIAKSASEDIWAVGWWRSMKNYRTIGWIEFRVYRVPFWVSSDNDGVAIMLVGSKINLKFILVN